MNEEDKDLEKVLVELTNIIKDTDRGKWARLHHCIHYLLEQQMSSYDTKDICDENYKWPEDIDDKMKSIIFSVLSVYQTNIIFMQEISELDGNLEFVNSNIMELDEDNSNDVFVKKIEKTRDMWATLSALIGLLKHDFEDVRLTAAQEIENLLHLCFDTPKNN